MHRVRCGCVRITVEAQPVPKPIQPHAQETDACERADDSSAPVTPLRSTNGRQRFCAPSACPSRSSGGERLEKHRKCVQLQTSLLPLVPPFGRNELLSCMQRPRDSAIGERREAIRRIQQNFGENVLKVPVYERTMRSYCLPRFYLRVA